MMTSPCPAATGAARGVARADGREEHVRRGLINVEHVRTSLNLADIFTKILSAAEHDRIRRILMGTA